MSIEKLPEGITENDFDVCRCGGILEIHGKPTFEHIKQLQQENKQQRDALAELVDVMVAKLKRHQLIYTAIEDIILQNAEQRKEQILNPQPQEKR